MQKELDKQTRTTKGLEHEKGINEEELKRIGADFAILQKELNDLTFALDEKQRELDV